MIKYFAALLLFGGTSDARSLTETVFLDRIEITQSGEYRYKFYDGIEVKDRSAAVGVLLLSYYMIQDSVDVDGNYRSTQPLTHKSKALRWLRYLIRLMVKKEREHALYDSLSNLEWAAPDRDLTVGDILNSKFGESLNRYKETAKILLKRSRKESFKLNSLCENSLANPIGLMFLRMNFDVKNQGSWKRPFKLELPQDLISPQPL